jgi:hypothetical protein
LAICAKPTAIRRLARFVTLLKFYPLFPGQQLNLNSMEDWYRVTIQDITTHGGNTLLYNYNYSIYKLLTRVFPEYSWLPWRFSSIPKGYWKDKSSHQVYLDWLGNKLGFKEKSDW